MIELRRCNNQETWDEYILDNGGHPLQLWGWGQVKTGHGWVADRVFAYEEDSIVAAAQVLTRKAPFPFRAISYVPRGPVGEQRFSEEFLVELARYTKRTHHSVTLSLEPDVEEFEMPSGWVKGGNTILRAETVILDLKKSESDLLTDMAKKTRQYIRKSAAEQIIIKQVHSKAELGRCLEVYRATSRRAKFNLHSNQYYLDVFNLLDENSPVFAAYEGDQPIAFLWLAISADISYELYGGMNERGQDLRANYALKWYAIRKAKEWGLSRYDFGGIYGEGISTFKKGWTDQEVELAGTFDKPLSPLYGLWRGLFPVVKKINQTIGALKR